MPTHPAADPSADPHAWPRRLITLGLITSLVGSSAPIPLYPIFRQTLGLDASTMTLIFAFYVVGALAALLTMGQILHRLANPYRLLVPAFATVALAALLMAMANSLSELLLARFLAGLATGAATVAANAALIELSPQRNTRHAALLASLSFGTGSSLGPILTGIALQMAWWPTVLPFVVVILVALMALWVAARRWHSHGQALGSSTASTPAAPAVGPIPWTGFVVCAAAIMGAWSMGSTVMALGPFFGDTIFHRDNYALSGYVVSAYLVITATSQWLHRHLPLRRSFEQGCAIVVLGLLSLALAAHLQWVWLAVIALLFTAVGHGASFGSAAGMINHIAPLNHRARLVSWFYVAGYLANFVPWGVGALIDRTASLFALNVYLVCVVLTMTLVGMAVRRFLPGP